MKSVACFAALASLAFSTAALAESDPSPARLGLGVGVGTLVGFGTGHAIQQRWSPLGWVFASVDGAGATMLLLTFGDCSPSQPSCKTNQDHLRTAGLFALGASHLVQFVELLAYGSSHGMFGGEEKPAPKPAKRAAIDVDVSPAPGLSGLLASCTLRF